MRIQTRLFLGTAALVLALVGVQWWLHARQLRAIEEQLGEVATTVGARLLASDPGVLVERINLDRDGSGETAFWVAASGEDEEHEGDGAGTSDPARRRVSGGVGQRIEKVTVWADGARSESVQGPATVIRARGEGVPAAGESGHGDVQVVAVAEAGRDAEARASDGGSVVADRQEPGGGDRPIASGAGSEQDEPDTGGDGAATVTYSWAFVTRDGEPGGDGARGGPGERAAAGSTTAAGRVTAAASQRAREVRHVELKVEKGEGRMEQFLVIHADSTLAGRIPIPVKPAVRRFELDLHRGLSISAALLVVGLAASGLMSRRLARPLQELALRSDELARGDLGLQVPVTASGEIGDLQRAFNRMSQRLAELEHERERWRQREHLAQLGDLARGLAHTLRNPLNTLGLAVDELATGDRASEQLAGTARGQIRRIDRWLRSFLAIGAGEAAARQQVDLVDLVAAVVLEAVQQGASIELEVPEDQASAEHSRVYGVPTALRAAIGNLVENAVQAAPEGTSVRVAVSAGPDGAEVVVRDQGPGLPAEVRERLFSPHVTTKVGGSGMGLFLARQLVVSMHGGRLDVVDAEGGGTEARVWLGPGAAPGALADSQGSQGSEGSEDSENDEDGEEA
jgi:signal transduction histidine kinase